MLGCCWLSDTYLLSRLVYRMRPAPVAVKLQIANDCRFHDLVLARSSRYHSTQNAADRRFGSICRRHCAIRMTQKALSRIVDENGPLPYKPRQLSAMTRFDRGGPFIGRKRPVMGPPSPDLPHYQAQLPGQRRTSREADLSTQQTGAQAPSRLPCPARDHRRPQGTRRAPRPGPQASERLSRASRRFLHGSAKAAGGLPRRCQWRAGH